MNKIQKLINKLNIREIDPQENVNLLLCELKEIGIEFINTDDVVGWEYNEPTTAKDTSEANLNIPVVGKRIPKTANCSWCNKRHKKEDMIYLEGKAEGNTIDYWLCDKCNFENDIA